MAKNNISGMIGQVPGIPIAIDPVQMINGIFDCYKNVTTTREEQQTLRTEIREKSRVYIAAIEANTKEFKMALEQIGPERMELIKLVCDLVRQEGVDEYSLKVCEKVIEYLMSGNPMDSVGKTLKFFDKR